MGLANWMPLRMWLPCLMCVTTPAWGSDDPEDPEQEVDDDSKRWKEACAFAPGGELRRISSSARGASMSQGEESFALQLGGKTV